MVFPADSRCRRLAWLLAAATAIILTPALSHAADTNPATQRNPASPPSRYLELVTRYRAGEWDATVTELAAWDPGHVRVEGRMLDLLVSPKPLDLAELHEGLLPDWSARVALVESVFLLHTEVFMRGALDRVHTEQAARALKALLKWPGTRPFVQNGSIVLSSLLLARFNASDAQLVLLRHADRTAEVVLALGSISESAAARPDRATPRALVDSRYAATSRFGTLENAGDLYSEALRLDPSLAEARVRLGRVLTERGFTGPAVEHLERARRDAPEGVVRYLAQLFLGAARERQEEWQSAAECYRAALAEYPEAQAARLGLGHALERSGNAEAGWQAVRALFGGAAAPRNPDRDPWWVYFDGQAWQTDERIGRLRGALRR
jgi:tetratricopeptide (TPR) repeat protein